jgi:RHS repeat-associated protein
MQTTVNGTTTLTAYIGSIEEVQTTGSTTTYDTVQGKRMAGKVNGSLYSFGYDALGSQVVVLNSNGNLVGSQLYGPYGNSRSSNGTLPTSIGFTGQRSDSVTGLDYYIARYYDPVVGQFLTADTVQGNAQGMDPYAYVGENPETRTDPTGERPIGCQPGTQGCSPTGVPTPSPQCGRGYELKGGTCVQDGNWPGGGKPPSGSGGGGTKTGVHPPHNGGPAGTPPCYGNATCLNAMQWLQNHWAVRDNQLHFVLDAAQLAGNILNILLNALGKGTAGLIIATLSVIGLLPSVLNLWEDWYKSTHPNTSIPSWALALAPALDGLATFANVLNGFVGLASWILDWSEGLIKGIVAHVQAIATNLVLSIAVGGGTAYAQEILDTDAWNQYQLTNNLWDAGTIIGECQKEGGC